jgi:hypothetical protein
MNSRDVADAADHDRILVCRIARGSNLPRCKVVRIDPRPEDKVHEAAGFHHFLGGTAACAWPVAACAQEPDRIYRLGDLHLSPRKAPWNAALFEAVKPDGFIDGQNLMVDDRSFGLRLDQLVEHAAAIVRGPT